MIAIPRPLIAALTVVMCITIGSVVSISAGETRFENIAFATPNGLRLVPVEVAETERARTQGLQGRPRLPEGEGMLLLWPAGAQVALWMKGTAISLDMIFIGYDGVITKIERNTEPFSEKAILAAGPVWGVVEMNAGSARRLGIEVGQLTGRSLEFSNKY